MGYFLENIKKTEAISSFCNKGLLARLIPLEMKYSTALLPNLTLTTAPKQQTAECEMFAKEFNTEEKVQYLLRRLQ